MIPFYWRVTKNFGDYMNGWLWPKILGDIVEIEDGIRLIGIGSLIKADLHFVKGKKVVFGSGVGSGPSPTPESIKDWHFYFVRGPLSAEKLGIDQNKAIVDGAWLISLLPQYVSIPEKKGKCFIPHFKTAATTDWPRVCDEAGFNYIDPTDDLESILARIAESELVVTESLHGAIFADYFRSPWIPVQLSNNFWPFKWLDWCRSVDVPLRLAKLPPCDFQDFLFQGQIPSRSCAEYSLRTIDGYDEELPVKTNFESSRLYGYKTKIRNRARSVRAGAFAALRYTRKFPIINGWNEKYRSALAKSMTRLAESGESVLSSDQMRNEKLELLASVRDNLVDDYNAGKLQS